MAGQADLSTCIQVDVTVFFQLHGRRKQGSWGSLGHPNFSVSWILNNFNGTQVSFTHSFLLDRAGGAGLADPAITGPMFWLRWCCWPFACTHIANTDLCPHELRGPSVKENRGDLRTSRLWAWWPHILNGRCSDIDWLSCAASLPGSQVYLKLPMPMDIMCVVVKQICYFTMPKRPSEGF